DEIGVGIEQFHHMPILRQVLSEKPAHVARTRDRHSHCASGLPSAPWVTMRWSASPSWSTRSSTSTVGAPAWQPLRQSKSSPVEVGSELAPAGWQHVRAHCVASSVVKGTGWLVHPHWFVSWHPLR